METVPMGETAPEVPLKKKRKKPVQVTSRSTALLRGRGYMVGSTERWIPMMKIRQDLFGFIDLLAVDPVGKQTIGVQATAGTNNASARVHKICAEPRARIWLEAGNKIFVHAWEKQSRERGKQKGRAGQKIWKCIETEVTLETLENSRIKSVEAPS
jgi:translation initiation factor IF-1